MEFEGAKVRKTYMVPKWEESIEVRIMPISKGSHQMHEMNDNPLFK